MKKKTGIVILCAAALCLSGAGCEPEQVPLYKDSAGTAESSTAATFNMVPESSESSEKAESSAVSAVSEADKVVMPDLTGKMLLEAKAEIKKLGVTAVIENEYSDTVEKTAVIRQSVNPGTQVEKGSIVTLTVSDGKKEPDKPVEITGISLNCHELTITEGKFSNLLATIAPADAADKTFTWYWSDDSIVEVSENGTVKAKAAGKATITVKTANGKSDSCEVTVSPLPASERPLFPDGNNIVKYNVVYHADDVYDDIDSLCEEYPDIMSQSVIGYSEQGRSIRCVTLGTGDKKACIVGGIHSREHITISFVMRCMEEYAEAYRQDRMYWDYNVKELLSEYTLYFVPMCNPDGTEISTNDEEPTAAIYYSPDNYKLNANGVNLNRNFPFNWENEYAEQTLQPGDETYAGEYGASEAETQAIVNLCAENDFLWLLDMHIVGGGIYWRDDYNSEVPGDWTLTKAIASKCGLEMFGITMTSPDYSGGLENWFRYAYERPGLCIELISSDMSQYVGTYREFNSIFDKAMDWENKRFIFLEAMSCDF